MRLPWTVRIRRDSLWSVLRSVRTQSQPLMSGPRWAAGPPTPASRASPGPETQCLARLKLSKGQASSSPPPAGTSLWGNSWAWGPVCAASALPDLDSRLLWPPPASGEEAWTRAGLTSSPTTVGWPLLFPVCEYSRGVRQDPLPCGPRALSVLRFRLSGRPPTLPQEPRLQGFPKSQPCW